MFVIEKDELITAILEFIEKHIINELADFDKHTPRAIKEMLISSENKSVNRYAQKLLSSDSVVPSLPLLYGVIARLIRLLRYLQSAGNLYIMPNKHNLVEYALLEVKYAKEAIILNYRSKPC